ncbi:MAG: hypothetical protein NT118_06280 [Lentisphaerae bacterium]|nr:hypothetical protein [Lentisphaerota bacterium]
MKTKIIWFAVGFLVSCLVWSIIASVWTRPRDYTANWSSDEKQMLSDSTSWLKHARGIKLGQYLVFAPVSKSNASLYVYDRNKHYPGIIISDSHMKGIASDILVGDSEYKSISLALKDGDAVFNSYSVSTGIQNNSITLSDENFDGVPDFKLGPGAEPWININSNWLKLIHQGGSRFVEIDGALKEVESKGGVWHLK